MHQMNSKDEKMYAPERAEMVERQLIARGISDERVLSAMKKVPRHLFVPEDLRSCAYEDRALPIGEEQTISQPYMVAIMTELLELKGGEKVLEIGTGSGYQAAILSELAGEVFTIERVAGLASRAENILAVLNYKNINIVIGDGTKGLPDKAPFDAIVVTAGCPEIPPPLIDQLSLNGRIVIPVGDRYLQTLTVGIKTPEGIETLKSIGCVFVPLIGEHGWQGSDS